MDGIAWASSAMVAARTRLEIAAGNLSNVSTDGFRKSVARGSMTRTGVTIERASSQSHGALRQTGRPLDLAIVGDGAFRVRARDGAVSATRDGNFMRDAEGFLRDAKGRALIGSRGAVRVPEGASIDERGRIVLGGMAIDRIDAGPGATIRTGFLECANVDAIGEMVDVITSQRAFESAEKVVSAIDGTRQKSANDVARVK